MLSRVEKFEAALAQTDCDAVLVTNLKNIYYLTGFSGTEATVFISKNRRIFLTDARYTLIAKGVVQGFDIVETRDAIGEIVKIIADDIKRLARGTGLKAWPQRVPAPYLEACRLPIISLLNGTCLIPLFVLGVSI